MKGALVVVLLLAGNALAQRAPSPVRDADLEEHLGERVPADLQFVDETGARVLLGDALRSGKPVLLVLTYFRCPALCGVILQSTVRALGAIRARLGRDFRLLAISIDARDTPQAALFKQASVLAPIGGAQVARAWPFWTGQHASIDRLLSALGVRVAYDARTDQFAHPAVVVVLTSDGRIARYLYGPDFRARDVDLALVEAGQGRIGTLVDRLLVTCYRYDPATRRYGIYVSALLRGGATVILLLCGGLLWILWRGERRRGALR